MEMFLQWAQRANSLVFLSQFSGESCPVGSSCRLCRGRDKQKPCFAAGSPPGLPHYGQLHTAPVQPEGGPVYGQRWQWLL